MAKSKIINFKIEPDAEAEFKRICEDNFTSPSHELRLFVHSFIKRHKGNKIPISELKHR